MKKRYLYLSVFLLLLCLALTACAVPGPSGPRESPAEEAAEAPPEGQSTPTAPAEEVLREEDGREYSASTLILSLEPGTSKEEVAALMEKYELELLYDMENLSMVSVRLPRCASAEEVAALMEALEGEAPVLGAMKDYILRLDDPVF